MMDDPKIPRQELSVPHNLSLSYYDFEGNFKVIIETLQKALDENPGVDLTVDLHDDSWSGRGAMIYARRMETDEEYQARLNEIKDALSQKRREARERKKTTEADERKLYEQLRAKYEK
jgi:predicted deacylase